MSLRRLFTAATSQQDQVGPQTNEATVAAGAHNSTYFQSTMQLYESVYGCIANAAVFILKAGAHGSDGSNHDSKVITSLPRNKPLESASVTAAKKKEEKGH